MSRALRRTFFDQFEGSRSPFPELIYSSRPISEVSDRITATLSLDWPRGDKNKLYPADAPEAQSVLDAIYRLQGGIERRLATEVELLDIRPGCITVRFALTESASAWDVQEAMRSMLQSADAYYLAAITAHIAGRAVRP